MKKIALLGALALAISGCAATDNLARRVAAGITHAAYDINAIDAALNDPATQAAIAELKAGSTMLACGFADASSETAAIGAVLSNSKSGGVAAVVHSTTIAYVVVGSLCPAMGGTLMAPVVVKAADIPATTKVQ
ncbi:MAG: hypothetical protein P4L76_18065 [Beijerinckiaceae bacterium]|nr:hypothetical protein [Beijerinckiaceae bacterium]